MVYTLTNKVSLQELYDKSMATIMGAGGDLIEWITGIQEWLRINEFGTAENFYSYTGKEVNDMYNLTGNNRFPDDLIFLSYDLIENKDNYITYCTERLHKGIRWFDDIVDNSRQREEEL